ncbi:MAG: hypothetical protein DMG05_26735 [Acidobacteria bacterium]|nr:MAG: hypothetical protein DMG05_26735 [Acidobacteriota bacterium]
MSQTKRRPGLATAFWTNDLRRAHRLAAQADTGFAWINCCNYWTPSIPYGGPSQQRHWGGHGHGSCGELYEIEECHHQFE